ncbi:MAG: hypothetical protein KDI09_20595 [Halioglobus sp.]|nr:hypothetical protein [Halioglobus sp.]
MKVILHIGTDKTGSTAIQSSLPGNRDWLLARSVYLPLTGLGIDNGHSELLSSLTQDALQALTTELAQAQACGYDLAFLSWEGMVRFNSRQIRLLASALGDHDVNILVYVRDQAEIIQSAHLQWVRMHAGARDIRSIAQPSGLLEYALAYAFLRDPRRNYYRTLRRWERVIPGAGFRVRPFSAANLLGGDVVTDLLQELGIADATGFLHGGKLTNPSLDVESALLVQAWKRDPAFQEQCDTLVDVTESMLAQNGPATRYFLDEKAVHNIRRHFRRCNRRLARRYMPGIAFPFPTENSCWRREDFAAIEARAQALARRVEEAHRVPTLIDSASGGNLPGRVLFTAGWSDPEPWGVWSVGTLSCIRFRLHRRLLNRCSENVQIALRGRYIADIASSHVTVNGRDLGSMDLSGPEAVIRLPIAELQPFAMVEICLAHELPPAPRTAIPMQDPRQLAFGLSSVWAGPLATDGSQ